MHTFYFSPSIYSHTAMAYAHHTIYYFNHMNLKKIVNEIA